MVDYLELPSSEKNEDDGGLEKKRRPDSFLNTLDLIFRPERKEKESFWEKVSRLVKNFKGIFSQTVSTEYLVEHKAPKHDENLSGTYEAMDEPGLEAESETDTEEVLDTEVAIDH